MSRTYAQHQQDLMPGALRGPYGLAWARAHGTLKDQLVARTRQSVYAGGVSDPEGRGREAPADALPRLGLDAEIERAPSETDASYRARIAGAWESWSWLGTRYGITYAVGLLGYGYPAIVAWRTLPWDSRSDLWARLRAFFLGRAAWTGAAWGAWSWGSRLVEDIEAADPATVRPQLRRTLRQWVNARDRVFTVTVARGENLWGMFVWGEGTWASATVDVWGPPEWGSSEATWGAFAWGVFC